MALILLRCYIFLVSHFSVFVLIFLSTLETMQIVHITFILFELKLSTGSGFLSTHVTYFYIQRGFHLSVVKPKPFITLANHNRCKQHNEPIRNILKEILATDAKCGKTRVSKAHSVLVEKVALVLICGQSQSEVKQNQSKREITFNTQLKTVLMMQ